MASTSKFVSTPELWFNGVFNFLPFSSIETLSIVNKHLHSLSRKVTHPTHLGIYPIGFWLNFVLPLLSYNDLKRFQQVSQIAKKLTLSKRTSKNLFRSDINLSSLKKIKSGKIDSWNVKPRFPGINPFLGTISYILNMEYEDLYVITKTTFDDDVRKDPSETHGIESYKAVNENATEPAVPILFAESFEKEYYRYGGGEGERPYIRVVGTGRPLFGGKHCSVTCGDVMKALVKDCERFSEWEGDHRYYEGFSSFEKANGQFVLGDIFWGS